MIEGGTKGKMAFEREVSMRHARTRFLVLLAMLLPSVTIGPGAANAQDLKIHIFDIGGGLCTLTEAPGGYYMVYDAGTGIALDQPRLCPSRIHAAMPAGEPIDLLVLSHSDADHINGVAELTRLRDVERVIRTGHERDTEAWCTADYWIKVDVDGGRALSGPRRWWRIQRCQNSGNSVFVDLNPYPPPKSVDFNLAHYPLVPGETLNDLGSDVTITLLHGLHDAPQPWAQHFAPQTLMSRFRNAISIVARLEFANRSVLFTGDSVGLDRYGESRVDAPCVATEADLLRGDAQGVFELDSDVIIAPHHGSSNGNCLELIRQVSPGWAIFAAGHDHGHPARTAVRRYLEAGVREDNLLRTDRGDNEGGYEWSDSNTPSSICADLAGDDDIRITLKADGSTPKVEYVRPHTPTCP
jgi:beta-lactamase superfamily II metal-dependent hydrolase